ncbi:DUF7504 family protein [Halogeometricum luteum]|uniref:Uncharacterized protein n=1 Tax=Halogeometricum luteum TaxID=2950537 RepID=A0ABU2G6A9_9EURY|nr:hypothetical protein [Halogeometricum sp. S3BR5-2]MDS0296326.1 hypothetical protein [Halogeometricum sp. S3BR5-2]
MKQGGCSILVSCDDDLCTKRASRRTLGSLPEYPRVVVTAEEDDETLRERLPRGVDTGSESVSVVNFRGILDEASTPQDGADGLRDTVCDAVDTFDASGSLGPGELRLSVDSMAELTETVGDDRTVDLLGGVTDSVVGVRGMAYYHVDADDTPFRDSLAASCDAQVDVRSEDDRIYQRWHLPEHGSTRWLHL